MDSPGVNEPFGDENVAGHSSEPTSEEDRASAEQESSAEWVDVEPEAEEPPTASLPVCPGGWLANFLQRSSKTSPMVPSYDQNTERVHDC